MMFHGFTEKTLEYFLSICLDNSKSNFESLRALYQEHVKTPLYALYEELLPVIQGIGQTVCVKRSRCVSGAFNDARFSSSDPVKAYMYLHFCAETSRDNDIPGFFMDASHDGYRYGLQIYHRTTQGMTRLRDYALVNERRFSGIIRDIKDRDEFLLEGESYKKERYLSVNEPVKGWLNRKSWWLGRTCPPDDAFFSPALVKYLGEGYQSLQLLYGFMCEGLMN
jgi:uncharacterized protein (DUF2461 family)